MDTQVTIAEYAKRHSVSVSTVRRRIKTGVLTARLVSGRYFIVEQETGQSSEQLDSQRAQVDDRAEQSVLVDRLQSEVDYLRGQLDKQTSLLAITAQQNTTLVKQLESPPRESVAMWLRSKLSACKHAVLVNKAR